ncbi:MAG TPA: Rieske 2Fe-2S domain-containing protein, partial [Flavisolibacter sp.]|nr:Rieske 2Fe-2S domain-containing protein [Flavisolibacter sp.]
TKFRWVKVADSINEISFNTNNIAELVLEERTICMGRYNENFFAFVSKCPHASGFFIEGYIDPLGNIVCPLHRYKFNLQNGRNVSGEGYYLKNWPVEIREDGVYVGFEKNRLFGLL